MRARSISLVTGGVLVLGAALAACASSSGGDSGGAGFPTAGASGGAAANGGAAASSKGGTSNAGASGAASSSLGGAAGGSAGTAGSASQASSSGSSGAGASGVATAGAGSSFGGMSSAGGTSGSAGSGGGSAGNGGSAGGGTSSPALKFVVFIDDYTGSWTSWAGKIDFSKITHLNLAFFVATTSNGWVSADGQSDADIKAIVDKAHSKGVKVLAALGGGTTDTTVVNQYKTPSNDDPLVSNLDAFLKKYDLDGADIDIEKESKAEVGDLYDTFVRKVVARLRPEGKLITADVSTNLQQYMNDDTLPLFDFVNVMIYTSNTADYTSAPKLFTGKGEAKTQVLLGIVSESGNHTSAATAKTLTAMSKAYGGPMLWDVAEDNAGSASVLKAIQDSL